MEHRVLSSLVEDFAKQAQIDKLPEFKQFEYFSNYTIISQIHPEAFSEVANLSDVDVDESGTFGLDAIAIVVNNNLVKSREDIDVLVKSKNLEVEVVFVQAKTSKNLDSGELLKFIEATKNFLQKLEEYARHKQESLRRPAELLQYIFSSQVARYLASSSPSCRMIFAYAGGQPPADFITSLVHGKCIELEGQVADFVKFRFECWNAERLIESYKQVENQFEVELRIKNNLALDTIAGVDQAYIGYVEVSEFVKLVAAPDGGIRRNVFYDNVRDFQGDDNSVNREIAEAITSSDSADKFVLYNNGVTVVSSFLRSLGSSRFLLRNYQIVNGCQTSNVIFANQASAGFAKALIPIKVVHTSDSEVVAKIIRANNRQTPVPNEAFLTLDKWHKDLQEYVYLESRRLGESLFYERRSREFSLLDNAPEKKRIVGLHGMVRAYAAVYMQRPHMVNANNPSSIIREKGSASVFGDDHHFAPYLASAMLIYKINEYANRDRYASEVMRFRYHVAMLMAAGICGARALPNPSAKKADEYCDKLLSLALDTARFATAVSTAFQLAEAAEREFLGKRDFSRGNSPVRSAEFTELLLERLFPANS